MSSIRPQLMRIDEAAKYFKVDVTTVRDWLKKRLITKYKFPGYEDSVRVDRREIVIRMIEGGIEDDVESG